MYLDPKTVAYVTGHWPEENGAMRYEIGECWGTKEREECDCGGDTSKCTFYPEVREKANFISELKIKQFKDAAEQLELFDKAEQEAIRTFVKQIVGEDTYSQKVNEIYDKLKIL